MSKSKGKRSIESLENGNGTSGSGASNGSNSNSSSSGSANGGGRRNGVKRGKNSLTLSMSPKLQDPDLKAALASAWKSTSEEEDTVLDDVTVIKSPFNCCILKNVIKDEDDVIIKRLKEELEDQDFVQKNNDLYKFLQSPELRACSDSHIEALKDFFLTQIRPWLQDTTGIELEDSIDMFCAKYSHTDHLLCHDDELEGRRIAYIMYFVPAATAAVDASTATGKKGRKGHKGWTAEDGGTLDLFSVDDNGCPKAVVKSLVPVFNSMAFFEVTPKSFHQVSEVLSKEKSRLSIGGWFHGVSPKRPPKYVEPAPKTNPPTDISEDDFYDWINPQYLDPTAQLEIQSHFEENSEISLPEFLSEEKFAAVNQALAKASKSCKGWTTVGPADRRCYDRLGPEALTSAEAEGGEEEDGAGLDQSERDLIQSCANLFQSDAFCLMLSTMTGLKLHPLAATDDDDDDEEAENKVSESANGESNDDDQQPTTSGTNGNGKHSKDDDGANGGGSTKKEKESDPRCRLEVRRWRQGCYTLLHDNDREQEFSLDLRMFFNCEGWSLECGGFSSYLAKDQDEELLTASPEPNTLALVYKDKETLRFVKYVNDDIQTAVKDGNFQDISVTYYE